MKMFWVPVVCTVGAIPARHRLSEYMSLRFSSQPRHRLPSPFSFMLVNCTETNGGYRSRAHPWRLARSLRLAGEAEYCRIQSIWQNPDNLI